MCKVMEVNRSGYYAWRARPITEWQRENQRLAGLIKQSWLESGGVYGYRKIVLGLRDLGEGCGKHRVYPLDEAGRAALADRLSPPPRALWSTLDRCFEPALSSSSMSRRPIRHG
jgi:hypothetical protein